MFIHKYYYHHYYYYYYYYYYPTDTTLMSGRLPSITFSHVASSRLQDSGESVLIM